MDTDQYSCIYTLSFFHQQWLLDRAADQDDRVEKAQLGLPGSFLHNPGGLSRRGAEEISSSSFLGSWQKPSYLGEGGN